MFEKLMIDTSQTPDKFLHLMGETLSFLLQNLELLNKLEQEIFERSEALKNPEERNQVQPGEKELWAEYRIRYKELTDPICMTPSNGGGSFGKPARYDYLGYPDTKIVFIAKSAHRAVIEMHYEYGIAKKEQFVLKKVEDSWKIDSKKYGFPDEASWWKDDL